VLDNANTKYDALIR